MEPRAVTATKDPLFEKFDRALEQLQAAKNIAHAMHSSPAAETNANRLKQLQKPQVTAGAQVDTLQSVSAPAPLLASEMATAPRPTQPSPSLQTQLMLARPLGELGAPGQTVTELKRAYGALIAAEAACVTARNNVSTTKMTTQQSRQLIAGHLRLMLEYANFFTREAPFAQRPGRKVVGLAVANVLALTNVFMSSQTDLPSGEEVTALERFLPIAGRSFTTLCTVNPAYQKHWLTFLDTLQPMQETLRIGYELQRFSRSTPALGQTLGVVTRTFGEMVDLDTALMRASREVRESADPTVMSVAKCKEITGLHARFHFKAQALFNMTAHFPELQPLSDKTPRRALKHLENLVSMFSLTIEGAPPAAISNLFKNLLAIVDNVYGELDASAPRYRSTWREMREKLSQAKAGL